MEKPDITDYELLSVEDDLPDIDCSALDEYDTDELPIHPESSSKSQFGNSAADHALSGRPEHVVTDPDSKALDSQREDDENADYESTMAILNEINGERKVQKNQGKPQEEADSQNAAREAAPSMEPSESEENTIPHSQSKQKWYMNRKKKDGTKSTKDSRIYCDLCDIYVNGKKAMASHAQGRNHQREVRDKILEPINKQLELAHREDLPLPSFKTPAKESVQFDPNPLSFPDAIPTIQCSKPSKQKAISTVLSESSILHTSITQLPQQCVTKDIDPPKKCETPSSTVLRSPDVADHPDAVSASGSSRRRFELSNDGYQANSENKQKRFKPATGERGIQSVEGTTGVVQSWPIRSSALSGSNNSTGLSRDSNTDEHAPRSANTLRSVAQQSHEIEFAVNKDTSLFAPIHKIPLIVRLRSEPESPQLRSDPVASQLRREATPTGFRSALTSSKNGGEPSQAEYWTSAIVQANQLSEGTTRGARDPRASAVRPTNWVKPVLWDPFLSHFNASEVGTKGTLVPEYFRKGKMSLSEWRELRKVVLGKGDDVDKLAFKIMQELLLSPTLGISKDALPALNRAIEKQCSKEYYSLKTGAYMEKRDLPEKLWVREPRFIAGDQEWIRKQTREDLALHLFCENVNYALYQAEDYEDVKDKTHIAALPLRGRVTGLRDTNSHSVELDGGRSTRYEDSLEADELFKRIHSYKLVKVATEMHFGKMQL